MVLQWYQPKSIRQKLKCLQLLLVQGFQRQFYADFEYFPKNIIVIIVYPYEKKYFHIFIINKFSNAKKLNSITLDDLTVY